MSHYMTALAMQQRGLKPAAKIVLYWLADHHNQQTGLAVIGLKELASDCEMDRTTLIRHLGSLEAIGLIQRRNRQLESGAHTTTAYRVMLRPESPKNPVKHLAASGFSEESFCPQNSGAFKTGRRSRPKMKRGKKRAVFALHGRKCSYCGCADGPFHIDHVQPLSRGGSNALENLTVACQSCNLSKGSKTLSEWRLSNA